MTTKLSLHFSLRQKQWRKEQSLREQAELKRHDGKEPVSLYHTFRGERLEQIRRGF